MKPVLKWALFSKNICILSVTKGTNNWRLMGKTSQMEITMKITMKIGMESGPRKKVNSIRYTRLEWSFHGWFPKKKKMIGKLLRNMNGYKWRGKTRRKTKGEQNENTSSPCPFRALYLFFSFFSETYRKLPFYIHFTAGIYPTKKRINQEINGMRRSGLGGISTSKSADKWNEGEGGRGVQYVYFRRWIE